MAGPPLDNWSTEDVTAVVCKFGRVLVWENDERNKGRTLQRLGVLSYRKFQKASG
jgi:hypothetical protein